MYRDTFFHNSGGGGDPLKAHVGKFVNPNPPPGLIWIAEGVKVVRSAYRKGKYVDLPVSGEPELLRMGYRVLKRPLLLTSWSGEKSRNPFEASNEIENRCVYCKVCDDYFPDDYEPCEHMHWCDECGCWVYTDTHVREDSHDGEPSDCSLAAAALGDSI
jgi:hypothetical protein